MSRPIHGVRALGITLVLVLSTNSTFGQQPLSVGETTPIESLTSPSISVAEQPTAPPPPPPYGGPLLERTKLTGDWGGFRETLRDRGITFDVSATQFYQGLSSGGLQEIFRYGGRADYYLTIDGQKAGLGQGLFINLHGETLFGQSVNFPTGAVLPVSNAQSVPVQQGSVTVLSGVKITQALSPNFAVFFGKLNTLDDIQQPFAAGRGVDTFMNTAFVLNPILARTVPYSTLGAGFAILRDLQPIASLLVIDTNNTPTVSGFDTLFNNGVTILGQINLPTKLFGQQGHQGFGFSYSTGKFVETAPDAFTLIGRLRQGLPPLGRETESWAFTYNFDQYLVSDETDPTKGWGLFGNAGLSDGNPNPIKWFANIGIGGSSPITSRKLDTFGIAYYYAGISDNLKGLAPRLLPIRDERGLELFYNIGITPWFHITPDVQFITPTRGRADSSTVFGLRAKVDF